MLNVKCSSYLVSVCFLAALCFLTRVFVRVLLNLPRCTPIFRRSALATRLLPDAGGAVAAAVLLPPAAVAAAAAANARDAFLPFFCFLEMYFCLWCAAFWICFFARTCASRCGDTVDKQSS